VPDATQTKCVPEPYIIALSGLGGEVMPTRTRAAYAQVTTSTGTPKSGILVSLSHTVIPEVADQLPVTYTGTLSTYGGTTGADGRLSFVFTAPAAGGTHTINATCTGCTNNPVTGTIKVPGCTVDELTEVPELSRLAGETQEQADLTKKLDEGMEWMATACSPQTPKRRSSALRAGLTPSRATLQHQVTK
jgi:hypothetical protein